jgi:hypothetical protein
VSLNGLYQRTPVRIHSWQSLAKNPASRWAHKHVVYEIVVGGSSKIGFPLVIASTVSEQEILKLYLHALLVRQTSHEVKCGSVNKTVLKQMFNLQLSTMSLRKLKLKSCISSEIRHKSSEVFKEYKACIVFVKLG